MSSFDKFGRDHIEESLLHSQIIYNSGYTTGANDIKKQALRIVEERLLAAQLMVDSELYGQLLNIKIAIEKI